MRVMVLMRVMVSMRGGGCFGARLGCLPMGSVPPAKESAVFCRHGGQLLRPPANHPTTSTPTNCNQSYAYTLDQIQVLMVPEFQDFPSTAITVEFWMQSVDTCRPGVPFSYAHGRYEQEDNSFLIFNYNSW